MGRSQGGFGGFRRPPPPPATGEGPLLHSLVVVAIRTLLGSTHDHTFSNQLLNSQLIAKHATRERSILNRASYIIIVHVQLQSYMYNRAGANAKGTHLKSPIGVHIFAKEPPPHKILGTALKMCTTPFLETSQSTAVYVDQYVD